MSLVVVGTDTDVGKTVVSAVILLRYGQQHPLAYWKPVATGARDETDSERVRRWAGPGSDILPETYLFEDPVSPHLAARREGRSIDPERILEELVRHGWEDPRRNLVIEGVGGVLVPLTDSGYLLIDLLCELHLPCIVVARSGLGTINHSLLTLGALRARGIEVAGVVLCGPRHAENRVAIERFGKIEVTLEVDRLARLGSRSIARESQRFDSSSKLQKYFE